MSRRINKLALAAMVAALSGGLVACKKQESSEALVAQAKQYQQKGDLNAALIQLKNALLANPDDSEARYMLAAAYIETGDGAGAEKEIRRAIALKYPAEKTMPVLVKALMMQGEFKKAITETDEEAKKNNLELLSARADAYLALNQRPEAAQLIDAVLAAQPAYPAALISKGRLVYLNGDPDGAIKLAEQAVAAAPKNTDALMFKADLLRAAKKGAEALAAYTAVLAAQPAHRTAYIERAYMLLSEGKLEAAQADLTAAKKIAPGSLMVTYTQALLDFTQGKNSAAQESLQKVLRVAPEHMPTVLLAGAVELNAGSMPQAERHLKKYLEKHPGNLYARKMLATALLRGGQAPDALTVLAPALKGEQGDVHVLALAGESYLRARDFDKATEYFEKASVLAPKAASLHTSLGLSRLEKGDKAGAISELELAAKLDTKTPQAGIALVRAELGLKNYDKAYAAVTQLAQAQPGNAVVHDLKGMTHYGRQELAPARASFEQALALQPAYFPAALNLAQLDLVEKKPADAKAHMQAFLEKNKKSAEAMTALAAMAASERNLPEATRWLELAQAENPDAPAPAIRLVSQYLLSEQFQKALTLARKVQVANPDNPELLELLAKAQLANNDKDGALESYSKLAAARPKSAYAQLQLASVHMLLKNRTAAEEDLKKALALQPDYPAAQLAQAEILVLKKQPEQAIAIARQLQKKYPDKAVGYVLEGDVLMRMGKAAQAVPLFDKANGVLKSSELAMKGIAALRAAGSIAEADKRLAQLLQQAPKDLRLQMFKAEQHLADKQYKQAAEQLEALSQQHPKNVAVLNNLAYAYQQNKDARALPTAEAAHKLSGDQPAVMDTLGWILVEQGDAKRGLALLQQASAKAPEARDIRLHLAMGLAKTGDKTAARKELEQLLAGGLAVAQADEARAALKQLQ